MNDSDDKSSFSDMFKDAKPVKNDRVEHVKTRPKAKARFRRQGEAEALLESSTLPAMDAEQRLRRDGVSTLDFRRLKRRQFQIEAEIDLHGLKLNDAKNALEDFLKECIAESCRVIKIIHGKGTRSGPQGPVIKPYVMDRLKRIDAVLAFCEAQPKDGGSGASYVLLKMIKKIEQQNLWIVRLGEAR